MSQFPQPQRPYDAHDTRNDSRRMMEDKLPYNSLGEFHDNMEHYSTWTPEEGDAFEVDDDLLQLVSDFLEEFGDKGREILHKLFRKVEKDIPLDKTIQEKIEDLRGTSKIQDLFHKLFTKLNPNDGNDPVTEDRGVNSCDSTEELKHKLERFKVKLVNVGGVVKVENQN